MIHTPDDITNEPTQHQLDLALNLKILLIAKEKMMADNDIRSMDTNLSDKFSVNRLSQEFRNEWASITRMITHCMLQQRTETDINGITTKGDSTIYKHESYGMVEITVPTCHSMNLFGSPIKHGHAVAVKISRAYLDRHLSTDWIHSADEIIEFDMSFEQWGTMLSSVGRQGTPCTLRSVHHRQIKSPDFVNRRRQHEDEFTANMEKIANKISKLSGEHMDNLTAKGPITKKAREDVANAIKMIVQEINSNIPYAITSFNETLEGMSNAARVELQSFMQQSALNNNIQLTASTVDHLNDVVMLGTTDEKS